MVADKKQDNLRTFDDYDHHGDDFIRVERNDESGKYCLTADYLEMDGMWQESYRKKCDEIEVARQRIEGLEGELRKETGRADAWVTAARDLSRELGVADEDSNGSIHDWRHIRYMLDMRRNAATAGESRLAEVEAERDAFRRDAERYEWLRDGKTDARIVATQPGDSQPIIGGYFLDKAIDAQLDAIRHLKEKS